MTSKPLREFLHVTNTELKDELITVRWLKKKKKKVIVASTKSQPKNITFANHDILQICLIGQRLTSLHQRAL